MAKKKNELALPVLTIHDGENDHRRIYVRLGHVDLMVKSLRIIAEHGNTDTLKEELEKYQKEIEEAFE